MGSWPHLNSVLTHTFPLLMQAQKHCPSKSESTHTATKIMRHGENMIGRYYRVELELISQLAYTTAAQVCSF